MATYNGEKFIREQLLSVLPQLSPADEVIVSDDGSSDHTLDIVRQIPDPRIKVFSNNNVHGVNANFSNALSHASGDYIFLCDQDDVWLPDKVETCLRALSDCDCVLHDCTPTDSSLTPSGPSLLKTLGTRKGVFQNIIRNRFTGCCLCFRKSVLDYVFPFPNTDRFFYDQWIGLNAAWNGKTRIIDDNLILFRRHDGVTSSAASASGNSSLNKISYRLILSYYLLINKLRRVF